MKHKPFPDKPIKDNKDLKDHIAELAFGAMAWLKIDGHDFFVLVPGDEEFIEQNGFGFNLRLNFPYKTFKISVQQDTIDKCLKEKNLKAPVWKHLEHSVFHELFHILTWPLGVMAQRRYTTEEDIKDADETLVDHLTNVFYQMVEDARKK